MKAIERDVKTRILYIFRKKGEVDPSTLHIRVGTSRNCKDRKRSGKTLLMI